MFDPAQSELWIQAMIYCGADVARDNTQPTHTNNPSNTPASGVPTGAKVGQMERLTGVLKNSWRPHWCVLDDVKKAFTVYEMTGKDVRTCEYKKVLTINLKGATLGELLTGTFKGKKTCFRLRENKKEHFFSAESQAALRDWVRTLIRNGARPEEE